MSLETIGLIYSSEGIPTAKESWLLGRGLPSEESWLEEIIGERIQRERHNAYQEYLRELTRVNERRLAELEAVREHARILGEYTLMLQAQAEERAREEAKADEAAAALETEFHALANEWIDETDFLSDPVEKFVHPAHFKIIGLGRQVVPLILQEVQKMSGHWFLALESITRVNPVKPEDETSLEKTANAWVEWGRRQGLI